MRKGAVSTLFLFRISSCERRRISRSRTACCARVNYADAEDRAIVINSAIFRCPVEKPVQRLHQSSERPAAVGVIEAVQGGQRAAWGDLEDRATAVVTPIVPAIQGCSVEVSVPRLHQRGLGPGAVRAVEVVQRGQRARGGDFEDRAAAALIPNLAMDRADREAILHRNTASSHA
jgi:hypothetical protein